MKARALIAALGLALAPPAWAAATGTLSIAVDPQRAPIGALQKQLQYMLAPQGAAMMTLRIMELPAELKTVARR